MSDVAQIDAAHNAFLRTNADRGRCRLRGMRPADDKAIASRLADQIRGLDLFGRLAALRSTIRGRIVFTTSFGLEDQAISHAIFAQALAIDVATLDTGQLFPETHQVWVETERRYGIRILAFAPERTGLEAGQRNSRYVHEGLNPFRDELVGEWSNNGLA